MINVTGIADDFNDVYLDDVPVAVRMLLVKQFEDNNISLENVTEEVFDEQLTHVLDDMKSRGVGIASKIYSACPKT